MASFGIDISTWQGDFKLNNAVLLEGVEFCIIKAGGSDSTSRYVDKRFLENVNKAKNLYLPIGVYYFGRDMTIESAKESARHFAGIVNEIEFNLPLYYDVEATMLTLDRRTLTDIVKAFCDTLKELTNSRVGIYASLDTFKNKLYDNELANYSHWVACWGKNKPTSVPVDIWQFGGETNLIRSNKISGVTCDQDYCYIDIVKPTKKEDSERVENNANAKLIEVVNDTITALEKLRGALNGYKGLE